MGLSFADLRQDLLRSDQSFVLVLEPKERGVVGEQQLIDWLRDNAGAIDQKLDKHGGVLFRGFGITAQGFKSLHEALYPVGTGSSYKGGVTPRVKVDDGVYLATVEPNTVCIPQHHELAYMSPSPSRIFFYCDTPADAGGETPITSTRRLMQRLDKKIYDKFKRLGVMYRRNFPREFVPGYALGWERAYETKDKGEVERFCKTKSINFAWGPNDSLITSVLAQGVMRHPRLGEELWYNSAYSHHRSAGIPNVLSPVFERTYGPSWTPEMREKYRSRSHEELSVNAYYGDGALIDAATIAELDDIYQQEQVGFSWEKGDCLVIDNILASHGRNPFKGEQRRILVSWKFAQEGVAA